MFLNNIVTLLSVFAEAAEPAQSGNEEWEQKKKKTPMLPGDSPQGTLQPWTLGLNIDQHSSSQRKGENADEI